jgi:hypothetical protein
MAADEIFITGTSKGLVPVVQVDDGVIADGRPGQRTRELMARMKRHTEKEIIGEFRILPVWQSLEALLSELPRSRLASPEE